MLTGYLATLPTDCLLSAGVLFCAKNAATTRIGVTEGAPDFSDNSELAEIMFDNRAPSRLKGLSRTTGFSPLIKGTLKEFGPSASGGQIAILEPGETEATSSGVTTATTKAANVFFAVGEYITDFRWIFERAGGGYAGIYAPLAIVRKWSMKGTDKKEALIAFEIEAVGDPINDLGTSPYVIETRTQLPSGQDELAFLRSNIIGGDTGIAAIYSPRSNFAASGGQVTQWDDARGVGSFGPSLTPTSGGNGVSITGADSSSYLVRSDAGKNLQSPLTSKFDLSTAKALVVVMKLTKNPGLGGFFPVNIGDDTPNAFIGIDEADLSTGGLVDGAFIPPFTQTATTRTRDSKLRLLIVRVNGTAAGIQAPPNVEVTQTITAPPGGNCRLRFGFSSGGNADETYRAALVLNHVPSAAEVKSLLLWARTYHAAVSGGPKFVLFEGDSLTSGLQASDALHSYPAQMLAGGFYADIDDVNAGVASATLQPGSSGGNNLPNRATVDDGMFDGTRTKNVEVVWAGTNDITITARTGAQTLTDLWSYCDARRATGWKVVVLTMIPRNAASGGGVSQATLDAERGTYNSGINSAWASHADAHVDLTTDSAFNTNSAYSNTTFYQADGIHLKDAGYARVASLVDPVLQTLL